MDIIVICSLLIRSLCAFSGETAYELFSIGMQKEMEGDVQGAIPYYQEALARDPDEPEIYIALASAWYQVREFEMGLAVAKAGLILSPDHRDLLEVIAIGYIGKGDYRKAISAYQQVLDLYPECVEYYQSLSILYEGLQDFHNAQKILLTMPDSLKSSETYVQLGLISGKEKDHVQAIEYYEKAFAIDSLNTTALIGIGTGYDFLNIQDSAIQYYEQALSIDDTLIMSVGRRLVDLYTDIDEYSPVIDIAKKVLDKDPEDTYIRRSLGYAYYKTQQFNKAYQEFLLATATDPEDVYSRFYIGRLLLDARKYRAAIREIKKALKINPDFIELWIYLGFAATDIGDFELAQSAFVNAAHRGGDLLQVYYLLGVIHEMQMDYGEAYRYYKKSVTEDPNDLPSLEALASLCDRLGKKKEAFRVFKTITEVDTLHAAALNYVGYMYAENNDSLEYALELINRALSLESSNGYFIDSRGWVFYQMGDYDKALEELQRAADIIEDVVILEHLGDTYLQLKDIDNARKSYERGLELDPDNQVLKKKVQSLQKE